MPHTKQVSAPLVWLASYPKCGSTWLREILNSILSPDMHSHASLPSFQREYPADAPLHNLLGTRAKVVKTHLYPGHDRMAACTDTTIGAVTIYRHPLDILLSALNYAKVKELDKFFLNGQIKTVEQIIEDGEFGHYIELFAEKDGFPWFSGPSGGISEYMGKWRTLGQEVPYLEICYEDMFADPKSEIRKLLTFLQHEADDAELDRIVASADSRTQQNPAER